MLTRDEKFLARILFENKILLANGQAFEDIFTSIMNYYEPDFRSIKPWGNIGDRKNDGYIPYCGIFYQVYAPENLNNNYPEMIRKLKTDFDELIEQWKQPINEFYFVVNDKYKGVHADSAQIIQQIVSAHKLANGGFKTAKDLENMLFTLEDDQICMITGHILDTKHLSRLDFSILNRVIEYIMSLPLSQAIPPVLKLPDWQEKIVFNDLSPTTMRFLECANIQVGSLEKYLSNRSNFLADGLRDKLNEFYQVEKKHLSGDNLFWSIVAKASPRQENMFQFAVIVIMAKYFESCDIFEEPLGVTP